MGADGCELCEAARMTPWHHEDDVCWIADCESCDTPVVVWRQHGAEPDEAALAHMLGALTATADRVLGEGAWRLDRMMRQIPDHFHAHARTTPSWLRS